MPNDFTRKALELADAWVVEAIHEALAANTGKITSADGDAARAALAAHLEGGDQLNLAARSALSLLERWAVDIDGEWGMGRSLESLESAGDIAPEILNLRCALAARATDAGKEKS